MRHGHYVQDQATWEEPTIEAKDGLVTKVSCTHPLDEESLQNGYLHPLYKEPLQNGYLAPRTASERFKDSTTNLEFSQVSLNTVKADHEAEWFSVPEPFDGPDCVENDWLILDASELWDEGFSIQVQDDYTWSWVSVEKEVKGGSGT